MNVQHFKQRLLEIEKDLSGRVGRASGDARGAVPESRGDAGDASVADVAASDHFSAAQVDGESLAKVRDALARIEAGTYGKCVVDGGPIEAKRLEAVPWTPYCLDHQDKLESSDQVYTL